MSLLAEQPRYGYEIEKTIEARGMREWTEIGFSSIYYLLKKLQIAGMISTPKKQEEGGKKARKVYVITSTGMMACTSMAKSLLAQPHSTYPSVLIGLSNIPLLSSDVVLEALNTRNFELDKRLAHIEKQQVIQASAPLFVNAIFGYSIALLKAEKSWLIETVKELEKN